MFEKNNSQIIRYGADNQAPERIYNAIRYSPTGKGCVSIFAQYIKALGLEGYNDPLNETFVNDKGQTMNDILSFAAAEYAMFGGYSLHFGFNMFGLISSINTVDYKLLRLTFSLKHLRIKDWARGYSLNTRIIDSKIKYDELYDRWFKPTSSIPSHEGKGKIFYYTGPEPTYPKPPLESVEPSALFENEAQMYSLSNIKNSFKASGVLKRPQGMKNKIETGEEADQTQKDIKKLSSSNSAGSIMTIEMATSPDGKSQDYKLFEPLEQTNVDKLYSDQKKSAKDYLLTNYHVPEILLGISSEGFISSEKFSESSKYFNTVTGPDRRAVERSLNTFWGDTIFFDGKPLKIIDLNFGKDE